MTMYDRFYCVDMHVMKRDSITQVANIIFGVRISLFTRGSSLGRLCLKMVRGLGDGDAGTRVRERGDMGMWGRGEVISVM